MLIKFKVIGKSWTLLTMDKKAYKKKRSHKNSVAVTKFHKRQIVLSPKGKDLETITHEILHAALYECCVHSADLTTHALEEVFAELLAKRGYEILALADLLYSKVNRDWS